MNRYERYQMEIDFSNRMSRAWQRCEHIAQNEKCLGYTSTYQLYMEIAEELRNLPHWIIQYEAQVNPENVDDNPPAPSFSGQQVQYWAFGQANR